MSSKLFDRSNQMMLKSAGDFCTVVIKGEPTGFYAIFDQENVLETDDAGQSVIITGSKLTAASEDVENIPIGTIIVIHSDRWENYEWKLREKMILDDGSLTQLHIVRM